MSPEEARRAWAYERVSQCQKPPPAYGSLAWFDLPAGSPEKWAAVILMAEKAMIDREFAKRAEDREYVQAIADHKASWTGTGFLPDPWIQADIEREWREWVRGAA